MANCVGHYVPYGVTLDQDMTATVDVPWCGPVDRNGKIEMSHGVGLWTGKG